jgi:uncharacterized protein YdhG (YjbR/CyaY superfamily)
MTVREYIASFPAEQRKRLNALRRIIRTAAPKAEECISYGMPCYRMNGVLVYFAGYKKHIGFYPTGSGIRAFEGELADFKHSKGAVQFGMEDPLPQKLITRMVRFRVNEDRKKASKKKKKAQ